MEHEMNQPQNTLIEKLRSLGKELPAVKSPAANYKTFTCGDGLFYFSGLIGNPGLTVNGPVGVGVTTQIAEVEAELAALSLLAAINAAVDGEPERLVQVMRLGVFVAASASFREHSRVANGASNLLVNVLRDRGRHARTAVGVASLPNGAAIEIDAIVRVLPKS